MPRSSVQSRARRRTPRPLRPESIRDLALSYVGRYGTTAVRLERYLARKLRERGWDAEEEPDIAGLVERFVELGYIDDAAFAEARSRDLVRRGYGARRVADALHHAGVERGQAEQFEPSEAEGRAAALALARRRKLGPFAVETPDPKKREKQLATLIRAGHDFDTARGIMDAQSEEEAEEWAASSFD